MFGEQAVCITLQGISSIYAQPYIVMMVADVLVPIGHSKPLSSLSSLCMCVCVYVCVCARAHIYIHTNHLYVNLAV